MDKFLYCLYCPCSFLTHHDLILHLAVCKNNPENHTSVAPQWKKGKYGDEEILGTQQDPRLTEAVRKNGKVVMNGCEVGFSQNGKWLLRRRKVTLP